MGQCLKVFQIKSYKILLGWAIGFAIVAYNSPCMAMANDDVNVENIQSMYESKINNFLNQMNFFKENCQKVIDLDQSLAIGPISVNMNEVYKLFSKEIGLNIESNYEAIKKEISEESTTVQDNYAIKMLLMKLLNNYKNYSNICQDAEEILNKYKENENSNTKSVPNSEPPTVDVVANPFENLDTQVTTPNKSCDSEGVFLIQIHSMDHYSGRCYLNHEINNDAVVLQNSIKNMNTPIEKTRSYYQLLAVQIQNKWQNLCLLDLNVKNCLKVPDILKQKVK